MKQTEMQVTRTPFFGLYIMNMYEDMARGAKKMRDDAYLRKQFEVIDDYIEQA